MCVCVVKGTLSRHERCARDEADLPVTRSATVILGATSFSVTRVAAPLG
jgi:hypothetical protein